MDTRGVVCTWRSPRGERIFSTYYSACLGHSIALAMVKGGRARMGERVYVPLAKGRVAVAVITDPVFYDPEGERQNV